MARKLFGSQLDDEKIVLVVRQHWVLLFFKLLFIIFMVVILALFRWFAPNYIPGLFVGTPLVVTQLVMQLYSLFVLVSLFLILVFYYLNVQIITNMRIVDVDQRNLFRRIVSELNIENIEDVTSDANGVAATVFNYGFVYVQTAGTTERFEFNSVPHPEEIKRLLLKLYEQVSQQTPNPPKP